ncbi:MAG: FTR1 family protein [Chloroflexi bacterium]|nr:FTR1 family protein [Chloroflexota bacterium]
MDFGALTTGLLTGLREGVEAALIVAIVLAYLAKTGNRRHFSKIWMGAGLAIAASIAIGLLIFVTVGTFQEPYEQLFEGVAMLFAAIVVTWMLFWMRRQARSVKGDLQARVDRVLTEGSLWGLAALAFTAVIREGIETSLFLTTQAQAAAQNSQAGAGSVLVGAVIGLAIAVGLGVVFYQGTRRINIASFFRWTGIALIFIAAGLLSHAVHEFVEIGWIGIATQTAYDISAVMPDNQGIGQFLRAIFGYSDSPEIITLAVHIVYVVVVLVLYLRPVAPTTSTAGERPTTQTVTGA